MTAQRVATVAGNPEQEAGIAAGLTSRSDVELVLRCVDRVELLASIRGGDLDVILAVGAPAWLDAQVVAEAARRKVRIVGVAQGPAEADSFGYLGVPLAPADADIDALLGPGGSVELDIPVRAAAPPSSSDGRVVAVWGAKGAPGRTSLAIELSCELARSEPNTILVDGDPYGGDVVQCLGIVEEIPTVIWAARMAGKQELDRAVISSELRRAVRQGPVVLPGLPRAELWPDVSDFGWRQLIIVLRGLFSYVICDVGFCVEPEASPYPEAGEGRNRMARVAVGAADRVIAVCRADPVGIKNFLWAYEELARLAGDGGVSILANRVRPGDEREVGEIIRRHVGRRPIAYVPDRPLEFARAVVSGVPVAVARPGSDVTAALKTAAASLGAATPRTGLLTRLSGRA